MLIARGKLTSPTCLAGRKRNIVLILVFAARAHRARSRHIHKGAAFRTKLACVQHSDVELLKFAGFTRSACCAAVWCILSFAARLTSHASVCPVPCLELPRSTASASTRFVHKRSTRTTQATSIDKSDVKLLIFARLARYACGTSVWCILSFAARLTSSRRTIAKVLVLSRRA